MSSRSRPPDAVEETLDRIEDLLRELSPRVLGAVVRRYGHFDLSEDAVQEAMFAAVRQWPVEGVPLDPGAWLITVAARRLADLFRSDQARRRREMEVTLREERLAPTADSPLSGDDSLVLLFLCCHPVLPVASQIALTLRAVGGLTTAQVARAFLTSEQTMTRRITRAKQAVSDAGAAFQMPSASELPDRLAAVLHVLYLIFNEGYATTSGPGLHRIELTIESIRLTRLLRRQLPDEPEVGGLLALMLLTDARRPARTDAAGRIVLLEDQDRSLWDADAVAEGLALVEEVLPRGPVGPYQLQAAIAAVHAEAPSAETTDWPQIQALYDLLLRVSDTPVVRLNHAVAVAMTRGPRAGLQLLDRLRAEGKIRDDHRFHAVRAQLLERAGRTEEARAEYLRAARDATSLPLQRYLNERAVGLTDK